MSITTDKQMRPRHPEDYYPTPIGLCRSAMNLLPPSFQPFLILDPGAGDGVWGVAARERWPYASIVGIELRDTPESSAYNVWQQGDYLRYDSPVTIPLIIGNPPYKLAEQFVRHALGMLAPGGYLLFLLRLAFLEGQRRGAGLWLEHPPKHVAVCSRRPSFTGNGKTDATAYAVFVWQRAWSGDTTLSFLDYIREEAA